MSNKPKHVTVYKEPNKYAGWPANHGMWHKNGELVVGFEVGKLKPGTDFHAIDRDEPVATWMAASKDNGRTWDAFEPQGILSTWPYAKCCPENIAAVCDHVLLPNHPKINFHDVLVKFGKTDISRGPSFVNYSFDNGRCWIGPYALAGSIQTHTRTRPGINARTCYLLDEDNPYYCQSYVSAAKSDGREGQPFVMSTNNGGVTWDFGGWLGAVARSAFEIMPSVVKQPDGSVIIALRRRWPIHSRDGFPRFRPSIVVAKLSGGKRTPLSVVEKDDHHVGNPPDMLHLGNGRLCVVYGYRRMPRGIAYRTSDDGGRTWSDRHFIRQGAGCHDIGYTRSTYLAEENKIVTVYYWNESPTAERYIAGTIWDAP